MALRTGWTRQLSKINLATFPMKEILCSCIVVVLLTFSVPANADIGHQQSVVWWRAVVTQSAQYGQTLQDLYAQVESQLGNDKSILNREFSKRLADEYPGSVFYGSVGSLVVDSYTTVTFDSRWAIKVITQRSGSLAKICNFDQQVFEVTDGPNRIKMKFDLNKPRRSQFLLADIPAISVTAHRIWALQGIKQGIFQPLKDILNDSYAYQIAGEGTLMHELAEQMVQDESTRKYVLDIAKGIYSKSLGEAFTTKNMKAPSDQNFQLQTQPQPIKSPSFNLFSLLPWYFWPVMIGIGVLNVLKPSKRRRLKQNKHSKRRFPKWLAQNPIQVERADFSMGSNDATSNNADKEFGNPEYEFIFPSEEVATPSHWCLELLGSLEWKRFETVCAEYLRLIGLFPEETRIGADGGVDIWVYKPDVEKPVGIVQCKAWSTYKVGIKPVRELFGVMAAERVANGKFMTTGEFTSEACAFAEGKRLQLISGQMLLAAIQKLPMDSQTKLLAMATEGDYRTPSCPQCATKMTLRQGKKGGRDFWGCPRYPRCRATLVYKKKDDEMSFGAAS